MDFMGRLQWANSCGKKQCRNLYWRVKAALKKSVKNRRSKQQFKLQYDPSSYALNFDDGCCHPDVGANTTELARFQDCSDSACKNIMWVYVLWVKS